MTSVWTGEKPFDAGEHPPQSNASTHIQSVQYQQRVRGMPAAKDLAGSADTTSSSDPRDPVARPACRLSLRFMIEPTVPP